MSILNTRTIRNEVTQIRYAARRLEINGKSNSNTAKTGATEKQQLSPVEPSSRQEAPALANMIEKLLVGTIIESDTRYTSVRSKMERIREVTNRD